MRNFDFSMLNSDRIFSKLSDFLYKYDDDTLLKLVPNECVYYNLLKSKNLDNCNNPLEVYDISDNSFYKNFNSVILIPLLKGYSNMGDAPVFNDLSSLELLKLLKKQLLSLKNIHGNSIYHGDISSKNILINPDLDYQFIDFDLGVVDDVVSLWNIYEGEDYNNIVDITRCTDKLDLLSIFLKRFLSISQGDELDIDKYKYLNFPKDMVDDIVNYTNSINIPSDYYFIDMIDYLISSNYDSPLLNVKSYKK